MYQVVVALLQPFTLLYLLAAAGVVLLWRQRGPVRGRLLLTAAFVGLTVLTMPASAYLALGSLEWQHPPAPPPEGVGAIVVLGGGVMPAHGTPSQHALASDSVYRCLHAATLYRQARLPVVVSGGRVNDDDPRPAVAPLMRELLVQLGVDEADVIVEDRSRTTYENATACRALLKEKGIDRVLLVSDASHLPRGVACFRKQGIDVAPAGCRYRTAQRRWSGYDFVPAAGAATHCQYACHEWLGLLWYWLHGRI
jgi:uncharacterized SAM-binding protein YcdF (DUF218 family)